ncbi:MAG: alcohol dehydrogenase catalytic domain-containing protein [Oscillospiraceae bacterium]|jgi:ribitol-5-phosphate 2-dehydrogenase|nr:alcohol dehydrogenase catalytic domain-containing protein [Oscillospiraceae bacterium]
MISAVYQLTAPRLIETTYKELDISKPEVLIRPSYMAICKADQRYYQGTRSQSVLKSKLPMALIHECMATVIFDPKGVFLPGQKVIAIPNTPTGEDDVIAENYRASSYFRSSGYDGFLQDYIMMPHDRLVKISDDISPEVAAFTELCSVSMHVMRRFALIAHKRIDSIGVWGDGSLGFIMAVFLKYIYPHSKLFVFGVGQDKLSYFTFADETYDISDIPKDLQIDHGFECVGGTGARGAINQIIDHINPEGTIALTGVSENFVDINTRMILEKGIRLFGSSRSGRDDFEKTVEFYNEYPKAVRYLENLVGDVVTVRTINDIHRSFDLDVNRRIGKTILKWEK